MAWTTIGTGYPMGSPSLWYLLFYKSKGQRKGRFSKRPWAPGRVLLSGCFLIIQAILAKATARLHGRKSREFSRSPVLWKDGATKHRQWPLSPRDTVGGRRQREAKANPAQNWMAARRTSQVLRTGQLGPWGTLLRWRFRTVFLTLWSSTIGIHRGAC